MGEEEEREWGLVGRTMAYRPNPAVSDLFVSSTQAKKSFGVFKALLKETRICNTDHI